MSIDEDWVPAQCTLPTEARPLRVVEFDDLFASALRGQRRLAPTRLRWEFDPAAERTVRDLVDRETACCGFFTFTVVPLGASLRVDVEVPDARTDVLDALASRAGRGLPA